MPKSTCRHCGKGIHIETSDGPRHWVHSDGSVVCSTSRGGHVSIAEP